MPKIMTGDLGSYYVVAQNKIGNPTYFRQTNIDISHVLYAVWYKYYREIPYGWTKILYEAPCIWYHTFYVYNVHKIFALGLCVSVLAYHTPTTEDNIIYRDVQELYFSSRIHFVAFGHAYISCRLSLCRCYNHRVVSTDLALCFYLFELFLSGRVFHHNNPPLNSTGSDYAFRSSHCVIRVPLRIHQ